jgi:hypothetical protein
VAAGAAASSLVLPFDQLAPAPGSSDGGDASLSDAPLDQGDAGASAYPDGSWCASQPAGMVFCDDFDFETTAFERWNRYEFDIQSSAGFSPVAESPPHSFALTVPTINPGTYYVESLELDVAPDPTTPTLSLSFAFRPAAGPDAGQTADVYVAAITQGPGAPRYAAELQLGPSGAVLREQDTFPDGGVTFPPEVAAPNVAGADRWTHVAIDVDLASPAVTVSFDGTKIITDPLSGPWSPAERTTVWLGVWYLPAETAFGVLYDDVVIRRR